MWPSKWRLSCSGLSYPSCELLARVEISFSFSQGEPLRLPRELKISRHRLSPLSLEKRKEREKIIAHSPACAHAHFMPSRSLSAPGEMVMFGGCYRAGGLSGGNGGFAACPW